METLTYNISLIAPERGCGPGGYLEFWLEVVRCMLAGIVPLDVIEIAGGDHILQSAESKVKWQRCGEVQVGKLLHCTFSD